MRKILLLLVFVYSVNSNSQVIDDLFTIVVKNNSTFDNTTRLGSFNPSNGFVSNIGENVSTSSFSINGGSLNPTTNKFNLVSYNSFTSFNLLDGSITSMPVNSFYSGFTNFTNVRNNVSDNTLYGLASTFTDNNEFVGMYLSKLNTENGDLTAISQNSIGSGYQLAGTSIDPRLMVYYYSSGSQFIGLDLYNGTIYSNPTIIYSNPNDFNFTNFTYNCNDDTIYGLVTEDTHVQNPNVPHPLSIFIMRFGKINPTTGEVIHISETGLPTSYYSVNAASTIDPETNTYYYSDGSNVYGISTQTGLLVSTTSLTFQDGNYINFMTNVNNCVGATAIRLNPLLSANENSIDNKIILYPNPAKNNITIKSATKIDSKELFDNNGRKVKAIFIDALTLDIQDLQSGVYFLKVTTNDLIQNLKFVKI